MIKGEMYLKKIPFAVKTFIHVINIRYKFLAFLMFNMWGFSVQITRLANNLWLVKCRGYIEEISIQVSDFLEESDRFIDPNCC